MSTSDANNFRFFQEIIFPARTLWARDKTYLLIFLVVNVIAGQVGVLTSLLLTWQSGRSVETAWEQTLSSGALYTFSISLVVSILAVIGSEIIDSIRFEQPVRYFEKKVVWSVLASALLVLQAPLVGALLSKPAGTTLEALSAKKIVASTKPDAISVTSPITSPSNVAVDATPSERQSGQVIFWIFSMAISLQLFCLYRIPLIPDSYARNRNDEVRELEKKANQQDKTVFDEQI